MYFFSDNLVTGGFPAETILETSQTAKKLLGRFAYFITGLINIRNLAARDMHFTAPGFEWEGAIMLLDWQTAVGWAAG